MMRVKSGVTFRLWSQQGQAYLVLALDDPDLFGNDAELLADFGSDLHQSLSVV